MLKRVTFTGIDNKTNPQDLIELQKRFPFVEFGVLVSCKLSNTDENNRYPSMAILDQYKDKGLNLSCHACGSCARNIVKSNNWEPFFTLTRGYESLFKRVQLNVSSVGGFSDSVEFPSQYDFLIQIKDGNRSIYDTYGHLPNVFGFHDNSGGTGVFQGTWMSTTDQYFGFAGGLCVENIVQSIETILTLTKNDFWVDMESSIRTDDWFDIDKCYAVAELCEKFVR